MKSKLILLCVSINLRACLCFFDIEVITSNVLTKLPKDFAIAIKDIAQGLPTKTINVVRGNSTYIRSLDMFELLCTLSENNVQVVNIDIKTQDNKNMFYRYLKEALDGSEESTSLILCEPCECEYILTELTENNLIHRTITYMFYWPTRIISEEFLSTMREAMRVAVITNPRESVFRVYYNQASPSRLNHLTLVNWWSGQLYKSPVLPPADKVYQDFKGRVFEVPVLHAPPWHFVQYNNDSSLNVTGGRDDKLLSLIANKLNFKYRYYDPPERSQGSSISGNGTFKGTLGLIWKRKADFFVGDVTMTWERLQAVEFSFLTLADSGAFLTHAPAKLSETLAIIRPFKWEVWPLLVATLMVSGPVLWVVIAAPSLWQHQRQADLKTLLTNCCWFTTTLFLRQCKIKADFFVGDVTMTWERLQAVEFSFLTLADSGAFLTHAPAKLSETLAIIRPFKWEVWPLLVATLMVSGPALWVVIAAPSLWQHQRQADLKTLLTNCCWFTTTLFLRQSSSKEPSKTHKARLIAVLVSLGATYVIGDMYSANLTSLLAKPAREQPIGNLEALEEAMRDREYDLVVERHSSSLAILQNGTGVYGRLARLMRRQRVQRVRSVEVGVRLVLARRKVAVLGGRETLFYDTERFGSHNFHLSEKLYTRYSAIALQIGCPFLETFNNVLMTLFEAGILDKMTTDEYKNLPEHTRRSGPVTESEGDLEITGDTGAQNPTQESTKGLEPVSLRILRGAFCLLGIGHLLAIIVLGIEIQYHRRAHLKSIAPEGIRSPRGPGVVAVARAKIVVRRAMRNASRAVTLNLDKAFGPPC